MKDVPDETPHAAEIRRVVREGWLSADSGGAFHPDQSVTRAEFVSAVNRMTGRADAGMPGENSPKFSDVDPSHPAYAEIMKAASTYSSGTAATSQGK